MLNKINGRNIIINLVCPQETFSVINVTTNKATKNNEENSSVYCFLRCINKIDQITNPIENKVSGTFTGDDSSLNPNT